MESITRAQRLRRVLILLCHFTRNLAYYKAGWDNKSLIRKEQFWVGINGNCLDIAVLEWCKLFGDKKDPHCWNKVINPTSNFEAELHDLVGGEGFWNAYVKLFRQYRDKYIAHWDNEQKAHIPNMDDALSVSRHYYKYVLDEAVRINAIGGLPKDIQIYYDQCVNEAETEYKIGT